MLIKTLADRGRCALNGPWTSPDAENVQRALAAVGCRPLGHLAESAAGVSRVRVARSSSDSAAPSSIAKPDYSCGTSAHQA